jgi:hypothetical protein
MDVSIDVGVEAGNDAGGLGLNLDLGDGLDFAGGDDGAGDVSEFGFGELRGFELGGVAARYGGDAKDDARCDDGEDDPEPKFLFALPLRGQGVTPVSAGLFTRSEVTQKTAEGFRGQERKVVRGRQRPACQGICAGRREIREGGRNTSLRVFAKDAEDLALDADVGGGSVNGRHLSVGGLQPDHAPFAVEALEGGIGAVDEGDDDLAFAGGACALDQNVVAGDDVFIAHRIAAHLEGEDLAVANDVAEGDAFGSLNGFDGLAGGDAA